MPDPSVAVAAARRAATIHELMGVEGAAARAYFGQFGQQLPSPFSWQGRQPRPARDPVNALLNLTYTLLTQELASLAEAEGLEVALGALHQLDRGRPSLALDLVEVFRAPVADRFVLALLRQHHLGVEDFLEPEGGGVVLSPPALRRYLGAYENWMLAESRQGEVKRPSYRNLLRAEVRKYLAMLRTQGEFEPFQFSSQEEAPACDISSVTI